MADLLRAPCQLDLTRPLLVGVSGGPDSLCLLDLLHAAGYRVIVAHFNHRLRPEADLEAEAVSGRARTMGLPFVTESADVRGYAEAQSLSLEEAARLLRYRFLFVQARLHQAQAVAVGHTADDQVETVLMHFLRGAGLSGLKGIQPRTLLPVFDPRIPLVRPILHLWRADTEAYCREHDLQPHYDASNDDPVYFRNRLRHALVPELEKYNPRFKEALLRTSQALQDDFDILNEVVEAAWKESVVESQPGWVAFRQAALADLSAGLRRNLLRRGAQSLRPEDRDFGFEALERASAYAEYPASGPLDLANGLYLFHEDDRLYLAAYEANLPFAQWPQVSGELSVVSGQCELGAGWIFTVDERPLNTDDYSLNANNWLACLDADRTGTSLTVRPPRPGERFQPLGMESGSVKLQDFFVNAKLPKRARANWPLVCARDGIAWIPGFRLAHPFRVTEHTKRLLLLHLEKK